MRGLKFLIAVISVYAILFQSACSNSVHSSADDKSVDSLIEQARQLTDARNVREALEVLDRAKKADPKRTDVYLMRATLLEQSARVSEALAETLAAHRASPQDSDIDMRALRLGINWMPPAESEILARQVVSQSPENPDGHLMLGAAIALSDRPDRFQEALRALQEANRLAPESATPVLEMGKLYTRMSDNAKAAAMLESAIGLLELRAKAGAMAITDLEGWLEDRRTAAFRLSQIYTNLGRTADARAATSTTSLWSARASELRKIKSRASAEPPDLAAREQLGRIARQGLSFWGIN